MFYVCVIDHTNKKILYAEEYAAHEDALRRQNHLDIHCEVARGGDYAEMDPAAYFECYLGEAPFHFPTPEEEAAALIEKNVALAASVRRQRDNLLAASDWTQTVADSPLSDKERAAWSKYRQALRDLPAQAGFPETVDWPVAPGA